MKKPYDPTASAALFPDDGWFKSSASDASGVGCVEINMDRALSHGLVGLRDSTQPDAGTLVFDETEWRAHLSAARSGECDWPTA